MRTAALYDIHGNLPALEAVLAEVGAAGVDEVVVGGDVVPGPMAGACLERLDALDVPVRFLSGNGEADVLAFRAGVVPARVPPAFHATLRWVADSLATGQLDAMARWPRTLLNEVEALGSVLFCHATPRDDNELFTELTPERVLRPLFEPAATSVVVCGHTHMPFDRRVGGVRVVNAGSVGFAFGDTEAQWLLLGADIEARRTPYDLDAAQRRFVASGYPGVDEFDVRSPPDAASMLASFEAAALG